MILRNVGLALFAGALVVIAMSQEVSIARSPEPAAQVTAQGTGESHPAQSPPAPPVQQALVVPEIEGESLDRALDLLESIGFEILVFDATHHSTPVADFEASTADPYVTAVLPKAGEVSEDGSVSIAVSWDRTGLPDGARRDPWWWPAHIEAVEAGDPADCSPCHEELGCTTCHVNRAHLYLAPGEELPDPDAAQR